MADNTQVTNGVGYSIRDKDRAGVKTKVVGIDVNIGGATEELLSTSNPMPVSQRDINTGRGGLVGTFQPLNITPLIGLVNSTFYATTSITDNYTTANTGSATTTVTLNDGFAVLASGTTNPSTAQITSKDFCTYNGIGELMFLNGLRAPQAGVAGCIRRWGGYDGTNGYFFEDNAGVFTVVGIKGGTRTAVASGSFNGLLGATYTLDQNSHFFQILMTGGRVVFMVDQVALHTLATPAGVTTTSGSLNLPIRVEVVSTQVVNMTLELRGQNIGRLGTVDSKRINEPLLDANDTELVRAVNSGSTGAANTYVNQTATTVGAKNGLDVHLINALPTGANTIGAVTGTFFQATQPVSLATNTQDVTDRAARLIGVLSTGTNTIGTTLQRSSDLSVTATGAAAAAVTLTLPAPAAGLFHYITAVHILRYATAALSAVWI